MNNNTNPVLCKNCNQPVFGNYCNNCGQSVKVGRINVHYIVEEAQHSIFHVDKGILYTIKELLLKPGYTIKRYLEGKRVSYFKPFAFVLILATLYGFISLFFNVYLEKGLIEQMAGDDQFSYNYAESTANWMYQNYPLAIFLFIPFSALSSFLVFRKSGFNYTEHVVVYAYIAGIQILISILFFFIYLWIPNPIVATASAILSYVYNILVLAQVFKTTSWAKALMKAIFSIILLLFIICFIVFVGTFVGILTGLIPIPEISEYAQSGLLLLKQVSELYA